MNDLKLITHLKYPDNKLCNLIILPIVTDQRWRKMDITERYLVLKPYTDLLFKGDWISRKESYKIVGTCTKDKIDFDTEEFIEVLVEMGKRGTNSYGALYMNYKYEKPVPVSMTCGTSSESFYSLLDYNKIYFENPLKEPNVETPFNQLYREWEEIQNKIVERIVVIQKL